MWLHESIDIVVSIGNGSQHRNTNREGILPEKLAKYCNTLMIITTYACHCYSRGRRESKVELEVWLGKIFVRIFVLYFK
jgi:hypothetical protein